MCGRYTFLAEPGEIAELFEVEVPPALSRRYNVSPTQDVPAVRFDTAAAHRELVVLRWGLIPFWAKDSGVGARMINARAESAAEKPSFRAALAKQRCLILANGFYEWKKTGPRKQPYYFRAADGLPFAFAGLWDTWQPPGKPAVVSCTIITTRANGTLAPVHERMPVILSRQDYDTWLRPGPLAPEILAKLLAPASDTFLSALAVDTWVNSPSHDDERCLSPAKV